MAIEKEINLFLIEQKHALMRILEVAENNGDVISAIKKEIKNVDEKLYQTPPMVSE